MKNKYTAGPWEIEPRKPEDPIYIGPQGFGGSVAEVFGDTYQQGLSNAALISAAPDMAEALEGLISVMEAEREACGIYSAHLAKARAALKKAGR